MSADAFHRDTKNFYAGLDPQSAYSGKLLTWCVGLAGKRVLDYGCATGAYCMQLRKRGFVCTGVDANEEYVRIARQRGVDAIVATQRLPFEDKSFDTVLMFELLEHVPDPDRLLAEAARLARSNVLITVPNCAEFGELKRCSLTYEHMLDEDHIRFFTPETLSALLKPYFCRCSVEKKEPIYPHGFLPWYLRKPVSFMIRLGAVRPLGYFRLYAQCLV